MYETFAAFVVFVCDSKLLNTYRYTIEECADNLGTQIGATEHKSDWFRDFEIPSDRNLSALFDELFECGKFYRVKLEGHNECSSTVSDMKVIKIQCPSANTAGTVCCNLGNCSISIGATSISGYSYSWAPAFCLDAANISNPTFTSPCTPQPPFPVEYYLTVTDSDGCTNTNKVIITDQAPGTITFTPISSSVCESKFLIAASGSGNYQWSYIDRDGNPISGSSQFFEVTPSDNSDITVYVTVTNPCGSTTGSKTIPAEDLSYFHSSSFPTLVPTNAMVAGVSNKRLIIYDQGESLGSSPSYKATEYTLDVWNRWGERIYTDHSVVNSTTGLSNGDIPWDGIYPDGRKLSTGAYWFTLNLKNCANTSNSTQQTWHTLEPTGEYKWKYFPPRRVKVYEYQTISDSARPIIVTE